MTEGLNKVMLLGNLGADPELKITQGGQAILKLRLATTESYLDKDNTRQERTEWHQVIMWGKRGEGLSKILAKGDRIFVEGGLRTTSYEKDGEKRYRTEVNATNVILSGRPGSHENEPAPVQSRRQAPPATRSAPRGRQETFGDEAADYGEDPLPF